MRVELNCFKLTINHKADLDLCLFLLFIQVQPVNAEICLPGGKDSKLHAVSECLLDFYFEYKGGAAWPSASSEKYATQLRAAQSCCTQKAAQRAPLTIWRHLICIDFVLLNYSGVFFILPVASAGFLSTELPALQHRRQTEV